MSEAIGSPGDIALFNLDANDNYDSLKTTDTLLKEAEEAISQKKFDRAEILLRKLEQRVITKKCGQKELVATFCSLYLNSPSHGNRLLPLFEKYATFTVDYNQMSAVSKDKSAMWKVVVNDTGALKYYDYNILLRKIEEEKDRIKQAAMYLELATQYPDHKDALVSKAALLSDQTQDQVERMLITLVFALYYIQIQDRSAFENKFKELGDLLEGNKSKQFILDKLLKEADKTFISPSTELHALKA